VDVIAAGHAHRGLAHHVEGIGIIEAFSHGQALGRVDVVFDRKTRRVARIQLFAPRDVCAQQDPASGNCIPTTQWAGPAQYEGKPVSSDPAVVRAMAAALQRVHQLQATALGVSLEAPVRRAGDSGSPLGNLFADALRAAVPGSDVAVINNAARGLRADLPDGAMTFGRLYDVFPFDNRIVRITLSGAELGRWVAGEIREGRRSALGISGVGVRTTCRANDLHVDLLRAAGPVHDDEPLLVVTIASPTLSGSIVAAAPAGGVSSTNNAAIVREVVEDWFRRPGHLSQAQLNEASHQRPEHAIAQAPNCVAVNNGAGGSSGTSPIR
jgi:2',3'-cyclic-nucleotide 2'-phosphodiesterase (5'-nucleotidase family)